MVHLVCVLDDVLQFLSAQFACLLIAPWWRILHHNACWYETDIVCKIVLHGLEEVF